MTNTPPAPPAGWYPDPSERRLLRYWDGVRWTAHTHPASPLAPSATPPSMPGKPTGSSWLTKGLIAGLVVLLLAVVLGSGDETDPADAPVASQHERDTDALDDEPGEEPVEGAAEESGQESEATEPERATVPKVVNGQIARARGKLERADLAVRVVERPSWQRPGTVLEQRVRAGAEVTLGKTVVLVVATPMPRVPGVVGRTRQAAEQALRNAGFRVVTTTEAVTTGVGGVVLRQVPAGTTQLEPGSEVTVVVSRRVQPVAAPPAPSNCTPGYSPCLAPKSDYDCAGGSGDGPGYTGLVYVTGSDPYDLDSDGDGVACETS